MGMYYVGKVLITQKGILKNGKYYSCKLCIKERWFEYAMLFNNWQTDAFQDSNSKIYVFLSNDRFLELNILNKKVELSKKEIENYQKKLQLLIKQKMREL